MRCRSLIGLVILAAAMVAGCSIEPPLHLRKAIATKVQLTTKVQVDVMWQLNWQAQWQFGWDTSVLGPLGYSYPASMRLHIYTQGTDGLPIAHTVHNFVGDQAQMEVFVGTHNLLFHNNDSESLLFTSEGDLEPIQCYTRLISSGLRSSSPVYTVAQKLAGVTKADDLEDEPVALQPDGLFSLYDPNTVITDDPDQYVFEDGKYILKIEGELSPTTYIYLIQMKLLHNEGRVIGSAGGGAVTGMAEGVDLLSKETWTSTVSVPTEVYMDKSQDMLGARVFTFGIPGCNPYNSASVAASESQHFFVVNISYVNGSWRNIRMDITDQVRALPTGGVINLEVDVDDFPPDESSGTGGGGFNALVSEWNEETGGATVIN